MQIKLMSTQKFKDVDLDKINGTISFLVNKKWYTRRYTYSSKYPHYYIFRFENQYYRVAR